MSFSSNLTDEQIKVLREIYSAEDVAPKYVGTPENAGDIRKMVEWGAFRRSGKCMHSMCPMCNGTGIKKDGSSCIHAISCPCSHCSVR